jgi:hypothetical protein
VIRDLSEIADFEPGEILVAPQTDPSWTPLFMVSAGVVVDVGAMGSHAMIVQPRARHSLRGRRAERDEPDSDRHTARGGRLIRKGHRPRRLRSWSMRPKII